MIIISKNGKQVSFVLEQVNTNDGINAYKETYTFKPKIEELNKHVVLKVSSGTDINAILSWLGLPNEKGDLVTIEIGVKVIQSKLIQSEKKPEKEEESSSEEPKNE